MVKRVALQTGVYRQDVSTFFDLLVVCWLLCLFVFSMFVHLFFDLIEYFFLSLPLNSFTS